MNSIPGVKSLSHRFRVRKLAGAWLRGTSGVLESLAAEAFGAAQVGGIIYVALHSTLGHYFSFQAKFHFVSSTVFSKVFASALDLQMLRGLRPARALSNLLVIFVVS